MSKWNYDDVKDLNGKVIIVTGGNSGLGYESVKYYASKGAEVILASRSSERGIKAASEIKKEHPGAKIDVMVLNLGSLKSVKQFAASFGEKYNRLDILLNNAGIMFAEYGSTEDGFEQHMGVNHFGHFALTGRLLGIIKNTPDARIVNISSMGHRGGSVDYDKMVYAEGGSNDNYDAYGSSKLANLLFTYELQRKVDSAGLDIKVFGAHPGGAMTNLVRRIEHHWWFRLMTPVFHLMANSPFAGALPGIRASLDPEAQGGQYYGPDGFQEFRGKPVVVQSSPLSKDKRIAKEFFEKSEELTTITYNFDNEVRKA